jgi:hypothetical protein
MRTRIIVSNDFFFRYVVFIFHSSYSGDTFLTFLSSLFKINKYIFFHILFIYLLYVGGTLQCLVLQLTSV